ncbi:hypothetical protein WJX72_011971 [[Myrmecia] bisecta]|uniref:Aquaporin n=1 Tax=[Myrmecia] bisecta TaxID=41462 RepID=A0AAW1R9F7_9CHLO
MARPSEQDETTLFAHNNNNWTKHNPVTSFMEISSEPVMYAKEEEDGVDRGNDFWAAFKIYGGNADDSVAAYGNGITLAIVVYATANVSGGHINPAVTLATCLTGHTSWGKGFWYAIAQFLGGIFGALINAGLQRDAHVGAGAGPGCFTHLGGHPIGKSQLFWWETIMTFTLVSVVFAVAVTKPGHGNIGPLAVGYTLFASAFVGGPYTGAALNPARVFGPALVYDCYWNTAFIYIFGEFFGALIAATLVLPLYGFGQFGSLFDTRLFSMVGLNVPNSMASHHRPPPGSVRLVDQEPPVDLEAEMTSAPAMRPKPSLAALAEQDRRPHPAPANVRGAHGSDSPQWSLSSQPEAGTWAAGGDRVERGRA